MSAVIVTSLLLRQALPAALQRLAEPAAAVARERPYEATRASYTRRAFALDRIGSADSTIGFATLEQAALGVPLWDAGPLARSAERVRRGPAVDGLVSWRAGSGGIVADVVERPAEQVSESRQGGWTAIRLDATDADERGGVVTADPARGSLVEESGMRLAALVFDSAGDYVVVADSLHSLAAAPLDGFGSRLAHAWSQQNFRILFGDLPAPDPRIVLRRAVRDRVDVLAPFFVQGDDVWPLVIADSLYWVVHLYSASSTYPLSQHLEAAGDSWSYFQHAATAVVNAGTGRVTIVADPLLDPIAATWVRRFPELFTSWSRLPSALPAALPPAADGASAQAAAFARAGPRGGPAPELQLAAASAQAPDTAAPPGEVPPIALPSRSAELSLSIPLLDAGSRLRGTLIAAGGADRSTVWIDELRDPARWTAALDRFQRVGDSLTALLPRDARVLHGSVRVVPVSGRLVLVAPYYNWRPGSAPAALAVAVIDGDSLHVARTMRQAVAGGGTAPAARETPANFRARVDGLYDAMRAALRAGDWAAFGRAYDALGVALGKPPR